MHTHFIYTHNLYIQTYTHLNIHMRYLYSHSIFKYPYPKEVQ